MVMEAKVDALARERQECRQQHTEDIRRLDGRINDAFEAVGSINNKLWGLVIGVLMLLAGTMANLILLIAKVKP